MIKMSDGTIIFHGTFKDLMTALALMRLKHGDIRIAELVEREAFLVDKIHKNVNKSEVL